jgi:hypothetical protein
VNSSADWREVLAEVNQAGLCARPIRLRGVSLQRETGELAQATILVACKDRRAAVCPSCSRLYRADAWQLVAAGIRGGKGVDPSVVEHPPLFVTLTAPSFGPVHRTGTRNGRPVVCRPRRSGGSCSHGRPLSCMVRHGENDAFVGDPLCSECFDYPGAVLWNAHVPRLWERTSLRLYLEVARHGGLSERELRAAVRLSYMKVVEFQCRGLAHLHIVLRADGAGGPSDPPPTWLDARALSDAVHRAATTASVALPSVVGTELRRASWGPARDVRVLMAGVGEDATAIAAYVAKYASKTADGTAWLAHPIRSAAHLERLELRPHVVQLVRTAWRLGASKDLEALRLRAHAHTLGYTGQFSSKSLHFSTTFGALRLARAHFAKSGDQGQPDYDGEWRFAGRGYLHPEADELAATLLDVSLGVPGGVPTSSPKSSHCP